METADDTKFLPGLRRTAARLRALLSGRHRIFQITVLVPTVVSIFYFGFIASDVYVTESRIVVRTPQHEAGGSTLSMLFQDSGFAKAQDDVYAVRDFILSRNALRALDEESRLRKAFSGNAVDFFSRFPFFFYWDESFEALYLYYQRKVEVDVDSDSSILTLTTRAFSAEDSFRMNQHLLHLAEGLVNTLNERGRQDLVRFAQHEVDEAEDRAKAAAVALARYRNEKGVIDPEHQSTIPLEQISKLQGDLIETRSQMLQIEKVAQDNPQLPLLRLRAHNLESAIQAINESVAGAGARSLAGKAADFQRLSLDLDVSGKLLSGALDTLQQARNAALRQQLYVEQVAQPVLPDKAMEPHRARNIAATLALGLVLWGVVSLLVAAIREHRD